MKSDKPKKEPTIDITDLLGEYNLKEVRVVIKKLKKRIKNAKNGI